MVLVVFGELGNFPLWGVDLGHCVVVSDHFSYKNLPNNLVRGLFLNLDIRPNVSPTCKLKGTFLGLFRVAQMAPNYKEA
jgi:hypothetical protein